MKSASCPWIQTSPVPSSISVQQKQFISQLHWAKVCLWAGVTRGHVSDTKAEFSDLAKLQKKKSWLLKDGKSTLQRNTRHSVFVGKRDKAVIYVSRWKVMSFSCALKVSSTSLIYWTITLFIHGIIYSLNYLNEWLFMI